MRAPPRKRAIRALVSAGFSIWTKWALDRGDLDSRIASAELLFGREASQRGRRVPGRDGARRPVRFVRLLLMAVYIRRWGASP